jgi:hypothetical protein
MPPVPGKGNVRPVPVIGEGQGGVTSCPAWLTFAWILGEVFLLLAGVATPAPASVVIMTLMPTYAPAWRLQP